MKEIFLPGRGARSVWDNPNTPKKDGPFRLAPGERGTIIDLSGCGVIRKLWMTMDYLGRYLHPQNRERNRQVWIEFYWDDADEPAICAPVGEFFGHVMGRDTEFENYFFSDPSGRTMQTHLPMPFRKRVRIDLINRWSAPITMYHELRVTMGEPLPEDALYLHAHYSETISDEPDQIHTVLPKIYGKGRYLGTHLGLHIKREVPLEWQHGGFSFTIDSDTPNMITASLDDYCGSSWDYEHVYHHRDGGLLFSEHFPAGDSEHAIYCYHRRDPLYFYECCGATYRARSAVPVTQFVEWFSTDPRRLAAIRCEKTLDEAKQYIGSGAGHFDDYISFYPNHDMYSMAYYYLDRP